MSLKSHLLLTIDIHTFYLTFDVIIQQTKAIKINSLNIKLYNFHFFKLHSTVDEPSLLIGENSFAHMLIYILNLRQLDCAQNSEQ